ncbi:hypothetical protein FXN63_01135 [Pigmentiphaga aceris]|uniref:Uncharacterized protein n=1 Tax=Pigmentiphaga aceris TaxID=1940612 RepID=A0A5C0AV96_9BURK|nr:hypothetical protein [Pigmentiphaga aceris]QEI04591.1 hypothetical protein FXN63_01135 [Pigmentiphaga aceris]
MNSTITATGPRQLDGRWRVSAPREEMVVLRGVPVFKTSFLLDDARRLSFVEHGELACRLSLGDFVYPAGTEIESADGDWRTRAPDAWMFITTANRQALRKSEAVAGGDWVVQSLDGRLHDVIPAAQTRRPFARFKTEGVREPRPPSPEASCGEMMSSMPATTLAPQVPTLQ